jgi:hypothetical protein
MLHLEPGERVEADDGYVGESPRHIKCRKSFTNLPETKHMQQRVRSRQETINNRLKFWEILKIPFRHTDTLISHGDIVRAILCITQVAINHGERLFETGYKDPPYAAADPNNPPLNTGWQRRQHHAAT